MQRDFEFCGSGLGYLWVVIWTGLLTFFTLGLAFPWAYTAQQRWICANTYINGRQLGFTGSGLGFFWQWLVIMFLTFVTFGLYLPWAFCRFKRWETENTYFADSMSYQQSGGDQGIPG